ncbi:ShlB/FhaC/HecB family hemolysin secretion/activation protein [Uliginosibacterium aquaticum]|uniref:ShlB/FhaC/HecB family hemolysin secretion/activation protein n=1 Tax=Uliginosibacterium aquaticum TaxID=2731212 RepID=A0ABX2IDZ1_9RHOO|nr:ShlB/FhaC/HecB family hemolysin secretion/activation protein [Uliginosibacterium aquaticum]NSL54557.1 ShlB/FhaC/HecB family hemolysin secretion/activation protein [Uliginosibacterium aquaticum]
MSVASFAQIPVDVDRNAREQLLRQERERALREEQEQRPDVRLNPPKLDAGGVIPDEVPCFPIDRIRLSGEGAEGFDWALSSASEPGDLATGRCLGAQGVNVVMSRIQNAIVKRGFITTRVLAGDQDLKRRELVLTIVPGRLSQIRFDGAELPVSAENAIPLASGDLLQLRAIEQGLENFKRVPTVDADIQIVPATGSQALAGESDLLVSWKQARKFRLSLTADDAGSRATGKNQGAATLSLDNPLTLSDLFYVSYNHALAPLNSDGRSTDGYSVHYSLPIGFWTLSSNFSDSNYSQTVAGASQAYVYSGKSQNAEIKLGRILLRNATSKTSAAMRGWSRAASSFVDDTEILVQKRRTAGWGAELNHRAFLGKSTLDMTFDYRRGTGAMTSLEAPEESLGQGTSRMELMGFNAQLDIPFSVAEQRLRYMGSWRQQWNRTPLTSQDRLSIGNRYTVRGFDGELTLMGERGFVSRNEFALSLGALASEGYWALDYGRVMGFPTADQLGRSLLGTAIGLRGALKGVSYDVFVGAPVDKPSQFKTAGVTAGFNLAWSY